MGPAEAARAGGAAAPTEPGGGLSPPQGIGPAAAPGPAAACLSGRECRAAARTRLLVAPGGGRGACPLALSSSACQPEDCRPSPSPGCLLPACDAAAKAAGGARRRRRRVSASCICCRCRGRRRRRCGSVTCLWRTRTLRGSCRGCSSSSVSVTWPRRRRLRRRRRESITCLRSAARCRRSRRHRCRESFTCICRRPRRDRRVSATCIRRSSRCVYRLPVSVTVTTAAAATAAAAAVTACLGGEGGRPCGVTGVGKITLRWATLAAPRWGSKTIWSPFSGCRQPARPAARLPT